LGALGEKHTIQQETEGGSSPVPEPWPATRTDLLYGGAIAALIVAYLALWFSNARYVYGWFADDRLHFLKGVATANDWRGAFRLYNALHFYFLLIAAPLSKIAGELASSPLPELQGRTGQYRWFLLGFIVLHALLLAIWSVFLLRLTNQKTVAFLAVLLWASSPTFILWSPQADSRITGLLLAIPALFLMFSVDFTRLRGWRGPLILLASGTLFSFSQSTHYTSLYLIAPTLVVCWSVWFYQFGRKVSFWRAALAFGLGVLWWPALLEAVSYFVIGKPVQQGPLAELMRLRTLHTTTSRLVNIDLWAGAFLSQMGVALLILMAVGAWFYWREPALDSRPPIHRLIVASVWAGILYLPLTGAMAFFRQTSVLQPFLFLFAAVAIVRLPQLMLARAWQRAAASLVLLALAGFVQWRQAWATYQGHLGLGRAIEWTEQNRGSNPVRWFLIWSQIWEAGDPGAINSLRQLLSASPDTLVMSYMPWRLVNSSPALLSALGSVRPLKSFPTLWNTDTVYSEMAPFWPHWPGSDLRQTKEMSEARVYRAKDLQRALSGEKLEIREITADSTNIGDFQARNVIDHNTAPDNIARWESKEDSTEHWIKLTLASPHPVGSIDIVQPAFTPDQEGGRIQDLTISVVDPAFGAQHVWSGTDLQASAVIHASWRPVLVSSITIKIQKQIGKTGPLAAASIEEILLPGYSIVPPHP
jgi:hypothetical protein